MNLNWIRFRRPVKSPASNGWLSCPSTIPTPLLPLLSCLYLHLSSLYSSFFCVLTFLLPPTHPPPLALCVVLVVSNLLIDIRCHKRRQFQSSVEPLLSLIERTGRWRGSIDSTDWGKRERDKEIEQRKRDTERGKNGGSLFGRCVSTKRTTSMLDRWMDRWRKNESVWIIKLKELISYHCLSWSKTQCVGFDKKGSEQKENRNKKGIPKNIKVIMDGLLGKFLQKFELKWPGKFSKQLVIRNRKKERKRSFLKHLWLFLVGK